MEVGQPEEVHNDEYEVSAPLGMFTFWNAPYLTLKLWNPRSLSTNLEPWNGIVFLYCTYCSPSRKTPRQTGSSGFNEGVFRELQKTILWSFYDNLQADFRRVDQVYPPGISYCSFFWLLRFCQCLRTYLGSIISFPRPCDVKSFEASEPVIFR
jgi:hypothetical protein